MKKTIATKKLLWWQRADRLALLVPVPVCFYLSVGNGLGRHLWANILSQPSLAAAGAGLLFLLLAALFVSLPAMILWRAVSHAAKKAIMRNATFQAGEDFDYYRDTLSGISPTTVSLLMDLKIEAKKDVAALLLKYVRMGAVSMEGGDIRVHNRQLPGLLDSDRILLGLLELGQVRPANLVSWKKRAAAEAMEAGYLKKWGTGPQQSQEAGGRAVLSCATGCLSGCLLPILLFFGVATAALLMVNGGLLDEVDAFLATAPPSLTAAQEMDFLLSQPGLLVKMVPPLLALLVLLAALWLPLAALLRLISSFSHEVMWVRRTAQGELLTAQIAGLKNFLHDFSNLSQAKKEQLVLWDDFLIYAVVLEENERIVEDIFRLRNLHYKSFLLF